MNNIYETRKLDELSIYKIDECHNLEVSLLKKRDDVFLDIFVVSGDKKTFLGRFYKDCYIPKILVKNGKILIYIDEFIPNTGKMEITKVFALYNVYDDMLYALSEYEALEVFDSSINKDYLKSGTKTNILIDSEKKKRLLVRKILLEKFKNNFE